MSKLIYVKKFDTLQEADQFVKNFIDSEINLKSEYPYYVTDKFKCFKQFCIEYTC